MPNVMSGLIEVCVFRFQRDRSEYLLLKRKPDDLLYASIWQIITGTVGEREKAIDAALRELNEETGLPPLKFWVVPHTSVFYDHHSDVIHIVPLFAAQVGADREVKLSEEHERYAWFTFEEARKLVVWPGQKEGIGMIENIILGGEEAGRLTLVTP